MVQDPKNLEGQIMKNFQLIRSRILSFAAFALLAVLFLLGGPTGAMAKDKSTPPVAVKVAKEVYEITKLDETNLKFTERLSVALGRGAPSQNMIAQPTESRWIECNDDLCYCVGEDDCAEMVGFHCARPPFTQCGTLSDGSFGCSCISGGGGISKDISNNGRGEPAELLWR